MAESDRARSRIWAHSAPEPRRRAMALETPWDGEGTPWRVVIDDRDGARAGAPGAPRPGRRDLLRPGHEPFRRQFGRPVPEGGAEPRPQGLVLLLSDRANPNTTET